MDTNTGMLLIPGAKTDPKDKDQAQGTKIRLKYKTDLDKATLIHNFEKRGWQKA